MNFASLRLKQHLRQSGSAGGVAIEREDIALGPGYSTTRVGEERIFSSVCEEPEELLVRVLGVEKTCIKVDEIGAAPFGILPVGLADAALDGDTRSLRQSRRGGG